MKYTNDSTELNKSIRPEELLLRDALATYGSSKKQGEYTIDDYYALPDELRAELIDGVLYAMDTPTLVHQDIVCELLCQFYQYRKESCYKCHVYTRCDVQLNCDNRTMVQPDITIVFDRKKLLNAKNVYGAPDFIVEVLSPPSQFRDVQIKLQKYKNAGVRDCWIINPMKRQIVLHDFVSGQSAIYGFTDRIPVRIFDGNLIIDFAEINQMLEELFGADYN